jgi:hypothetical protein
MIMFARYIPPLMTEGVSVTFIAQPELFPLLSTLSPAPQFHSKDLSIQMHSGDKWTHLMSLPFLLDLPVKPAIQPSAYLKADRQRSEHWRSCLGSEGFKVGICWRGSIGRPDSQFKAMPLEQLAPLAEIPNVRLINILKDSDESEVRSASFPIETPKHLYEDGTFRDTAAIIENLDLVVTVDTSIAHVAGAMARPLSIMLHGMRVDWRWLHPDSTETAWYANAKLFRQQVGDNNWDRVIANVAVDIRRRIKCES